MERGKSAMFETQTYMEYYWWCQYNNIYAIVMTTETLLIRNFGVYIGWMLVCSRVSPHMPQHFLCMFYECFPWEFLFDTFLHQKQVQFVSQMASHICMCSVSLYRTWQYIFSFILLHFFIIHSLEKFIFVFFFCVWIHGFASSFFELIAPAHCYCYNDANRLCNIPFAFSYLSNIIFNNSLFHLPLPPFPHKRKKIDSLDVFVCVLFISQ